MDQSRPLFPKSAPIKKANDKILSQTEFTMSRRLATHNYRMLIIIQSVSHSVSSISYQIEVSLIYRTFYSKGRPYNSHEPRKRQNFSN